VGLCVQVASPLVRRCPNFTVPQEIGTTADGVTERFDENERPHALERKLPSRLISNRTQASSVSPHSSLERELGVNKVAVEQSDEDNAKRIRVRRTRSKLLLSPLVHDAVDALELSKCTTLGCCQC